MEKVQNSHDEIYYRCKCLHFVKSPFLINFFGNIFVFAEYFRTIITNKNDNRTWHFSMVLCYHKIFDISTDTPFFFN